ncbi:hypothetical protein [Flammeovirga sp. SJP92]|uniref:hypothetical protein n=1 Tax=Flammeovirga sp. SJP92 TaxID=1775430 RepID=UPI00078931A3|nr:hypothetical protein [Flammeovirga sp. SJP92]
MRKTMIIFLFLLVNSLTIAHEDTLLKVDDKGNIVGLPDQFLPAKFDLDAKKIRIKDTEVTLPKCMSSYIAEHENLEIKITASWYHSKELIPYYMNIKLSDKEGKSGYFLLVGLETLELIEAKEMIQNGNETTNINFDLSCLSTYKNNIQVLKK